MKVSECWLRELVNPAIDSSALAEQLTMAGLEVECIEPVASSFTGVVVVGTIVECRTHPNTDKLLVTKVDIGGERLLDIVCGAPNCRVDLRVVVATIGAVLPGNLKIQSIKWRGVLSEGMLCSFYELGMANNNNNGIIELPADSTIGQDIRHYLQLKDNTFHISITPNRSDCLSLLGIARDVAVLNHMPLVQPVIKIISPVIGDTLPIHIEQNNACPRYLGRVFKNINVHAPTPFWMQEKMRRCGIQSLNAIADIINYVMLELGQPMYAFDRDCIDGGIVVRDARHNELLTLIDGREVKLSPDTLVIADYSKAIAMAGIISGSLSGIKPTTRNVVLECAFFQPLAINGRARRYGINHTDASYRYERGVDPELPPRAIELATALLISICGGQHGPIIDVNSDTRLKQPTNIYLRREKLNQLIGYVIPNGEVSGILLRLGFQVSSREDGWHTIVPSWRFDIAIEEDLIEEIARVYGYDAIPHIPLRANLVMPTHSEAALPLLRAKLLLVDRGYQEAITYSFVNPTKQSILHPHQVPLVLPSPMTKDMSVMRLSLWTGLLSAVVNNQNRQQNRIRMFESGLCFIPDDCAYLGICQEMILAGVITGSQFSEHWDLACKPVDFYDAKGDLEAILELTGKLNDIEFRAQRHPALHPGQSAAIYLHNEFIGLLGAIHPELESKLKLMSRTLVFELLWEKIAERKIPQAQDISCFPANRRDIAVVVSNDVAAADVIEECRNIGAGKLIGVNLFDVYRSNGIKSGFKSLAISLILQDPMGPLEEKEINAIVAKCVMGLKHKFHASLREVNYDVC